MGMWTVQVVMAGLPLPVVAAGRCMTCMAASAAATSSAGSGKVVRRLVRFIDGTSFVYKGDQALDLGMSGGARRVMANPLAGGEGVVMSGALHRGGRHWLAEIEQHRFDLPARCRPAIHLRWHQQAGRLVAATGFPCLPHEPQGPVGGLQVHARGRDRHNE
jgi:hypothetical protein